LPDTSKTRGADETLRWGRVLTYTLFVGWGISVMLFAPRLTTVEIGSMATMWWSSLVVIGAVIAGIASGFHSNAFEWCGTGVLGGGCAAYTWAIWSTVASGNAQATGSAFMASIILLGVLLRFGRLAFVNARRIALLQARVERAK